MAEPSPPRILALLSACCFAALPASALPPAPSAITVAPSSQSGAITLSWTTVPGATGYTLKRGVSPTDTSVTLGTVATTTFTALTEAETWCYTHFGTTSNSDNADPDNDGQINLIEFATGHLPDSPDGAITSLTKVGSTLEFTYRRGHAAIADGLTFAVEWSDTLGNDWSVQQVTQQVIPGTDNGISELWKATLPTDNSAKRFVRLKSARP